MSGDHGVERDFECCERGEHDEVVDPDAEAWRVIVEDAVADALAIYGPPDDGLPKHLALVMLRTFNDLTAVILGAVGIDVLMPDEPDRLAS